MGNFWSDLAKPPESARIGTIALDKKTDDWKEWQKLDKRGTSVMAKIHKLSLELGEINVAREKLLANTTHPKLLEILEERKKKGLEWLNDIDHITTPFPMGKVEVQDGP